ncbi:hypothetical protein GCM10019017_56610 [Streptomyces showdoensis]
MLGDPVPEEEQPHPVVGGTGLGEADGLGARLRRPPQADGPGVEQFLVRVPGEQLAAADAAGTRAGPRENPERHDPGDHTDPHPRNRPPTSRARSIDSAPRPHRNPDAPEDHPVSWPVRRRRATFTPPDRHEVRGGVAREPLS